MLISQKVSVEIGRNFIRVVQGKVSNNRKIDVFRATEEFTEEDMIDESLRVNNQRLYDILARVLINNNFSKKNISFVLSGQSNILIREMEIPYLPTYKTYSLLKFESRQIFPVNIDNYVIDFKQLSIFRREKSRLQKILLIAIPRTLIESVISISFQLGLKLQKIDIESNSLAKLVNYEMELSKRNVVGIYMIVNIMRYYITTVILKNNEIVLAKTFPNYELEKIYNADTKDTNEILEYYPYLFNEVIENIAKFYDFYRMREQDNMTLSNIFLTGEICNKIGLAELLKERMNTNVEYLNALKLLNNNAVFENNCSLNYTTTIGGLI